MKTNEELNRLLYKKVCAEQKQYYTELLSMSPAKILDNAYPFLVREDILIYLENNKLADNRARALLRSKHPLEDMCNGYMDLETGYMGGIKDAITETADELIRAEKAKANREAR